ncbi:uncharacterized protein LOC144450423 [Glandiceps talaboti]
MQWYHLLRYNDRFKMADDAKEVANNKESLEHENPQEQSDEEPVGGSSLENFVTDHYNQQKENGKFDTEEIDEDRAKNFFDRAIAESRRMNKEVGKSEVKLTKLHNELGSENFRAWRQEHAAEAFVTIPDKVMSHHDL